MHINAIDQTNSLYFSKTKKTESINKIKNIDKTEPNVCYNNSMADYNKININFKGAKAIGVNNLSKDLELFIKKQKINERTMRAYKDFYNGLNEIDSDMAEKLSKYIPTITETSFVVSHIDGIFNHELVRQKLMLEDVNFVLKGEFAADYNLEGELIDTHINNSD